MTFWWTLTDLSKRCDTLQTIYVDDCCKLRCKIQSIFGCNVAVKLDLFHATQRIITTLNRKCKPNAKCMQDLTLVFRTAGDREKDGSCPTPSTDILLTNFSANWNTAKDINGVEAWQLKT